MIQIILDVNGVGLALPESKGYTIEEKPLYQDVEMISGRLTRELRKGRVWVAKYQYGYFDTYDKDRFLSACRKGMEQPILCSVLSQTSKDLITAPFLVINYTPPAFFWSNNGEPLWGDYSVELREVTPH